jgi:FKBP-type peptidyl-prolyl cis-trans isomerase SlyD
MMPAFAESVLQVADGFKVTIEYTLTLPDKSVADSNVGQAPFSYIQGTHQIVPGLERALMGMKPGQQKRVDVSAEQGYGAYDKNTRLTVDKAKVPSGVKAGTLLRSPDGRTVTVAEVAEKSVVLDLNHPLAGKSLVFDVKVLKVEKPEQGSPAGKAPSAAR